MFLRILVQPGQGLPMEVYTTCRRSLRSFEKAPYGSFESCIGTRLWSNRVGQAGVGAIAASIRGGSEGLRAGGCIGRAVGRMADIRPSMTGI